MLNIVFSLCSVILIRKVNEQDKSSGTVNSVKRRHTNVAFAGLDCSSTICDCRQGTQKKACEPYKDWRVIAGYFDGDGSVIRMIGSFTVGFSLHFGDTWRKQIQDVRIFILGQGLRVSEVIEGRPRNGVTEYHIQITQKESARKVGRRMLPYLNKKSEDVKVMLDYLDNRITGEEAIGRLNASVTQGRRSGKITQVLMPYTLSEGRKHNELLGAERLRDLRASQIPYQLRRRIIAYHTGSQMDLDTLSALFGISKHVIKRIVQKPLRSFSKC